MTSLSYEDKQLDDSMLMSQSPNIRLTTFLIFVKLFLLALELVLLMLGAMTRKMTKFTIIGAIHLRASLLLAIVKNFFVL